MNKIFDFSNLKGDLMGGLVAGIVALPLALAFGVQSGLGAAAGLYGAIAVGIFAALFGGTPTQASGPTGPMTVVSASLVAAATQLTGSLETAMGIILVAFMVGGILQIIFGFLNIAGYVKYFPYPVVSGFMSGVGLIIIILQIFPFAGLSSPKSTIAVIQDLPRLFSDFNPYALGLGALTVLVYYVFPYITKKIPSPLIALLVTSLVAYFAKLDVPLIGEIPTGIPKFRIDSFLNIPPSAFSTIMEFALVLAVLGSIDSLLTSVIADNMTKTKHNSNRELIGQGIGNFLAGLFGGIPGAGATKGTVVNINSGGRTRISGAFHGLILLAVLLGLGKFAANIPLCVLAGLLIPIGFKIIDLKGLKHLKVVPRADAAVLMIVLLITTFGSLINAVGIGVALAALLFMKKSGDLAEKGLEVKPLNQYENESPWEDEKGCRKVYGKSVLIKHLYGPLFFGFTSYFKEQFNQINGDIQVVIIRMNRVPYIDQSGLYALEDAVFDLNQRGIKVLVTGLQEQPYDQLTNMGIIPELIPKEQAVADMREAINFLENELGMSC